MAIDLEHRYRGLRVAAQDQDRRSRAARASAPRRRGKDFGVIATEKGWNLYVCGNGGMTPAARASCSPSDLDDETLIRYIDRFLMFYVRTADRLQRTAPWLDALEGGLDYLAASSCDDSLGHRRRARGGDGAVTSTPTSASGRRVLDDPEKLVALRVVRQRPRGGRPHGRLRRVRPAQGAGPARPAHRPRERLSPKGTHHDHAHHRSPVRRR